MFLARPLAVLLASATAALAGAHATGDPVPQGRANADFAPAFENQTRAPALNAPGQVRAEVIASGLEHPWAIAVLPGGGYLVTERAGRLRMVSSSGAVGPAIAGVPRVAARGQGGLLDVALADDFDRTRRIFLTYSKPVQGGAATALASAVMSSDGTALSEVVDLFVQTPAVSGGRHFGSRVVVDGPHLYVTVGDRGTPPDAQDRGGAIGKVHRLTLRGTVPGDNPFSGAANALPSIWTYGHRNPQGAALHPVTGDLWTLEHGPRGGDELNRITPGTNYGWPVVSYGENYSGTPVGSGDASNAAFEEPRYYWDPVIAPGDFTFYDGDLFDWQGDVVAASLNPGGIVRLTLDGDRVTGEARYLDRELGRVRDVAIDRDGALILLTDYDDGDIVRVVPAD